MKIRNISANSIVFLAPFTISLTELCINLGTKLNTSFSNLPVIPSAPPDAESLSSLTPILTSLSVISFVIL